MINWKSTQYVFLFAKFYTDSLSLCQGSDQTGICLEQYIQDQNGDAGSAAHWLIDIISYKGLINNHLVHKS
jgi:hypothetical protein